MNQRVSVIVPAKIRNEREAEWLKIAIASVPKNIPIILVDDHSIVDWDKISKICGITKHNVYHLSNTTGLAAARNRAMAYVTTEFFFPLDADDFLAPNALDIALEKYPGNGFLYGSTVLFNDKTSSIYKARSYDICKLLDSVYWPNGCLQKTENWKAINGWDETLSLYEDWDYWIRSYRAGIYGHSIEPILYHYRQNPNGIISTLKKNVEMTMMARDIIQSKHRELFTGEDPMCNCGNKMRVTMLNKKTGKVTTPSPVSEEVIRLKASAGMVILTYVGRNMTQSYYGKITGTLYRFGTGKSKYGYVAEADVAGFLGIKEGGKNIFVIQEVIQ